MPLSVEKEIHMHLLILDALIQNQGTSGKLKLYQVLKAPSNFQL